MRFKLYQYRFICDVDHDLKKKIIKQTKQGPAVFIGLVLLALYLCPSAAATACGPEPP